MKGLEVSFLLLDRVSKQRELDCGRGSAERCETGAALFWAGMGVVPWPGAGPSEALKPGRPCGRGVKGRRRNLLRGPQSTCVHSPQRDGLPPMLSAEDSASGGDAPDNASSGHLPRESIGLRSRGVKHPGRNRGPRARDLAGGPLAGGWLSPHGVCLHPGVSAGGGCKTRCPSRTSWRLVIRK